MDCGCASSPSRIDLIDAGTRPAYLPVAYVEPFESSGNLIGVDLSTNKIYAQLMGEARKAGPAGRVAAACRKPWSMAPASYRAGSFPAQPAQSRHVGADRPRARKVMRWAFCN